ncbi:hypothetical protein KIW84_011593 [Lathyrus oleraceus]|uniref:Large ribosomal subunit protein bL25 L25 domain-containing protein n=2 Tax=Pisum sativum TaxID=3888 RepID=A0A9D5GVA9_PEA|nr:hypothetical protein KIW84_011593 [Pisum sativum]
MYLPRHILIRTFLHRRPFSHSAAAILHPSEPDLEPLTYLEGFPKPDPKYDETILAIPRRDSGKNISAKERKVGRVPSIVFEQEDGQHGGNKRLISVRSDQIRKLINHLGRSFFLSRLFHLQVLHQFDSDSNPNDDNVIENVRVLPRSIHLKAGTDAPLNVTFIRAPSDALLKVDIPIVFIGDDISPGLKKGPMKAYSTEIFREEKQGLGLSTLSAAWGIGLVIGPALGGYLAQPAVKYPHLFPKDSFWDKFPYFLPSLSVSAFAFVVAIACIWLPETLHNHPLSNESIDDAEALETGNISNDDDKIIQKDENLFLNWPLMSSIIVYNIFSLYNVAYQEVFSLWVVSPGRFGGLNFTTDNVGDVLTISGIGLIVSQLFLYPSLERAFGPIKFARISAVLSIPLLQSYPFIAMLSGITLYLVINIASLLKNVLSMTIITGLFIMQNRAVEQHQRGAANGIAMTIMSIFKAIGPAGGGAV